MIFGQSSNHVPHIFNIHVARHFELIFSRMTVCVVRWYNRFAATREPAYWNVCTEFQFFLQSRALSYLSATKRWEMIRLHLLTDVVCASCCRLSDQLSSLSANWIPSDVLISSEYYNMDYLISPRRGLISLKVTRIFSWKLALLSNESWIRPIRTRVNESR